MITFQKESFLAIMPELPALFYALWEEHTTDKDIQKLDVAWDAYTQLEKQHHLHLLTARDGTKLVGYFMAMITPSLHYKTLLTSFSDSYYMYPEYRKGLQGLKLFREADKMLAGLGVKKSFVMTNTRFPITILLKRLKYVCIEHVFAKFF